MFGSLFESAEIKAFAHALADEFAPHLSADVAATQATRAGLKHMERRFSEAEARALAFARERRLGVLGKARLCNALRWRLKDQGTDPQLSAAFMERIVNAVSRDRARA